MATLTINAKFVMVFSGAVAKGKTEENPALLKKQPPKAKKVSLKILKKK